AVLNSATQDSTTNAHNKTQLTYPKINCVNLNKTLQCPHTNDDSIFTHKGKINLKFKNQIKRSHSQR
ncbi:hypothetical protein H5410_055685, partial [Solanum commersonii]